MGSNGKMVKYARKLGNVSREIEGLRTIKMACWKSENTAREMKKISYR